LISLRPMTKMNSMRMMRMRKNEVTSAIEAI
jgi:hypothetical protein